MGASPTQQALESANASVDEAVKSSLALARRLGDKAGKYRQRTENLQTDITGYLGEGQDPASYYSKITQNFGAMPSMPEQQAKWQGQLNEGDYPVLGSPSHKRMENTLMRTFNAYQQGISRGLDEIQPRFASIAQDPSFNLQYDPRAMQMAQGNVNEDQIRRLTNYGV
jgi:hypothetical protein